ncbi:unnamed protein product [Adineta steineri]|uniref:4-alpha-glucanotransferase n=1 Tax=Adineta steineri TaxID=433720 RepID=A0A813W5L5_9BILA|nr:unnamed protein product [Adineta steineri]CAF0930184.1 unnamed protein product [Adineta steineri]CAF3856084.1 unnamed protein product [Adineta steineri]CAF4079025.1 unnamed protein product [Adineta steineri]
MNGERAAGILLHITSLPSPYGIGDFGPEAYKFVDFLHETNQKLWQILPLTPTEKCSPYSSVSAFAGNPLLISPDKLYDMKLLTKEDLIIPSTFQLSDQYVKFKQVTEYKHEILKKAFENFQKQQQKHVDDLLKEFLQSEHDWLDDYSLYMTIKEQENKKSWSEWPHELKIYQKNKLQQIRETKPDLIQYYIFIQYIFHEQWTKLKTYANQLNIKLIGDMPIYVDYNSVDVWANTKIFQLDNDTLLPSVVSGYPPDDCSTNGQNWNTPIYNWNDNLKKPAVFNWWIKRLEKTLQIVDIVRIDHFRGLESYWSIPVDENHVPLQPKDGQWVKAPGTEFFNAIFDALGKDLPLIVEDLGNITKEIIELRDQFNLTGIRILQFAFTFQPDNLHLPHNYLPNCTAYTGTHDSLTVVGWWTHHALKDEKKNFLEYINIPIMHDADDHDKLGNQDIVISYLDKHINWYLIQMVLGTVANRAIIEFQDVLGLGNDCRMNDPSLSSNPDYDGPQNWTWRFTWSMLHEKFRTKLKFFTNIYNRK